MQCIGCKVMEKASWIAFNNPEITSSRRDHLAGGTKGEAVLLMISSKNQPEEAGTMVGLYSEVLEP